jgi:peptidoglycan hydrolase-like protein with peptidoglycan-binding domain
MIPNDSGFPSPAPMTAVRRPKSPMMTGTDVLAVQRALNQRENAGLDADSTYGPATRDAVIKWQQREHLGVDGIVGPQTRSSLGLPS